MKKQVLFIFLLFFLLFSGSCLAQETSSEEYYQISLRKFRLYQASSSLYNNVKSKHLSYQSVSSRAEYLEFSKKYLILEIESAEAYANFVRRRLAEATKILNYQENLYFIKLDDEITFLSSLKKEVESVSSVSEFLKLWQVFDQHYQTISSYGFAVKSYIEIGSLDKVVENLKVTKEKISQYLSEIPADNPYAKAGKDKFSVAEKEYGVIVSLLNQAKSLQKNSATSGNSISIRKTVDQDLNNIQLLVSNYQKLLLTIISR